MQNLDDIERLRRFEEQLVPYREQMCKCNHPRHLHLGLEGACVRCYFDGRYTLEVCRAFTRT